MAEAIPHTLAPAPPPAVPARGKEGLSLWDENGFSFGDLLDAVNPLQHLPIIGTLYRELTGDGIGAVSRLAGGVLFAGLPGLIGSAVNTAFEAVTGKDIGETALAYLFDETPSPTAVAANAPPEAGPGSALDLALLEATQTHFQKEEDKDEVRTTEAFALRFDRQFHAYEKGLHLTLPESATLKLNA